MRRLTKALLGSAVLTLALLCDTSHRAAHADELVGIVKTQPAKGPFVKIAEGFMVPYVAKIPGTDITFEMIPVPGGKFQLGSPDSEADRNDDEGPQIAVNVTPMWVAKTEVTWQQYQEFMNLHHVFQGFAASQIRVVDESNRADAITAPTPLYEPTFTYEYGNEPEQPAVTMTLYSAQNFTKWLSGITGQQYRLPTEAEWEYAARGGTSTAFSWGNSADSIDDYAHYFDNCDEGVQQVASKKPNPYGLHDMHGGVAEWTVNRYTENGYQEYAQKTDLQAVEMVQWRTGEDPGVVRGGSWEGDPEQLRSAARLATEDYDWKSSDPNIPRSPWWFTDDPTRGIGFRVFRSYKPLPKETIQKFWNTSSEDVTEIVQRKLDDSRGYLGLVDKDLPKAIKEND